VDIDPVPGDPQRAVLTRVEPLALADSDIKSDDAARNALSTLIDSKCIQQAH
jgi:sulfonate transport system substrate-binding protein